MVSKGKVVEVEIDAPRNRSLLFPPLRKRVRGRFDVTRMVESGRLRNEWADPIPGQRLRLNTETGEAMLIEPLLEAEHAPIRERILARGFSLGKTERFESVHIATWAYHMGLAVESGMARVVSGELLKRELVESEAQASLFIAMRPGPIERLVDAIEKQTNVLQKLLEKQLG